MMRHRAVLLGLVGALLIVAAFDEELRWVAGSIGLASMVSYVVLWWPLPSVGESLRRIAVIDVVAIVILAIGLALDQGLA